MKESSLITILGPTASGKTSLACALAYKINGEIISADSRQVYRGMDIGTGKDISEFTVKGKSIPYHMIDIVPAGYKYNLYEYKRDFSIALHKVKENNHIPIICGGTGLYIEALLNGYTMVDVPVNESLRNSLKGLSLEELRAILSGYRPLHNTTDTATVKRAVRAIEIASYYHENKISMSSREEKLDSKIFGIDISRQERRDRITQRLKSRMEHGMIEEVDNLLKSGISPENLMYYGLEYKFITKYIVGELSFEEMFSSLEIAIHQFAKRQMTWFRGMEKRGVEINWIDFNKSDQDKVDEIIKIIA